MTLVWRGKKKAQIKKFSCPALVLPALLSESLSPFPPPGQEDTAHRKQPFAKKHSFSRKGLYKPPGETKSSGTP